MRPTAPGDAERLFANMRKLDFDEVSASGGPKVLRTIFKSIELTPTPETAWAGDDLLAIRGVVPTENGACIWMLGTDALTRHKGAHTRLAAVYIAEALRTHGMLFNFVHAKNTPAIRWLQRLGFTINPPAPIGYAGEDFHYFEKRYVHS
jgi:ribosomal protein S18 acetylase RimI-like enzyme